MIAFFTSVERSVGLNGIQPVAGEATDGDGETDGAGGSKKRVMNDCKKTCCAQQSLGFIIIMKKKTRKVYVVLSIFGLLASCAPMSPLEAQYTDTRRTAENARTYEDHESLAKQYENIAEKLRVKAEEKKQLLQHYEEKSYLYGKQAPDRQSHTWALLRKYEKAAKETIKQASFHQKMALGLAEGD